MKVGILNAIPPDLSQVNWGGTPVDAYIRFLKSAGGDFEYAGFEVAQGRLPASTDSCDAYVITGSSRGVYDDDEWIKNLSTFIREAYVTGKKLVGICFGHQILAHALGGRAEKSEKGWGLGLKSFTINQTRLWMDGQPDKCALYFVHQDQVVRLPPGAELLGGNDFCPNAMYTIDGRVLGVQGHPEFSAAIMDDLLARKEGHVDEKVLSAAVASLGGGVPDSQAVGSWIVGFLKSDS